MFLARDGAFDEAAAAYPPSTAQLSANPHDALLPALYQLQAGKPDVAAASMGALVAAAPDLWAALDLALVAASERGDAMLAAATAERLFVVRPTLAIVRMVRMATAAGDHDAALAALERAAAPVGQGNGAMTLLIGPTELAHPLLSDATTAELALLAAASLDPAASDRERKRAADGIAASSGPPAGDLVAARLLRANGDLSAAAALAQRARARAPVFLAAAVFEANAHVAAGDAPGALKILDAFIAAAPRRADARLAAARVAAASGDDRAAEIYLEGAPEALVYQDETLATIALGVAARGGEDNLRRATDAALRVVSTEQVAIALMAVGHSVEAAALARAVLSADPLSQTAPGLYLDAMTRAGARAEAAALLETLVRRHPDASAAAAALYRARDADSGGKTG
jgi:tetratricopeptide (TPR) repeat protein